MSAHDYHYRKGGWMVLPMSLIVIAGGVAASYAGPAYGGTAFFCVIVLGAIFWTKIARFSNLKETRCAAL